jgi:hypothetical protein
MNLNFHAWWCGEAREVLAKKASARRYLPAPSLMPEAFPIKASEPSRRHQHVIRPLKDRARITVLGVLFPQALAILQRPLCQEKFRQIHVLRRKTF